jgi:hypothetical protein
MQVEANSVPGVEICGPETEAFQAALRGLLGREPDRVLKPALPFSVVVFNRDWGAIAFLGVRFDMRRAAGDSYSVIHYADSLRNPGRAELRPGAARYVCAEPLYTDLVLRQGGEVDRRAAMNIEKLRAASEIHASIDCVALEDGTFRGPDALGAFERFALENMAESMLIEEVLRPGAALVTLLDAALEIPVDKTKDRALLARRALARHIAEGLYLGGMEEAHKRAHNHRLRITLRRDMR